MPAVAGTLPLLMVCFGTVAQAQTAGALTGIVTETTGSVIPGASVTVSSEQTGVSLTTTSSSAGVYRFPVLTPGGYRIKVTMNGFETVLDRVTVTVSETATLDLKLPVGSVDQQVSVDGSAGGEQMLQTDSSSLGRVVTSRTVTELPLATRNFTQLMTLSPGMSAPVNNSAALGRGTAVIYGNGARQTSNAVTLDGTDAANIHAGALAETSGPSNGVVIPSPEAIAEFKVQTGMYDAQYGRNAGAVTALVTKSGTNKFHGSIYEFFRNDALNANTFLFKQNNKARAELKQNQFGGALGGPIFKDKDFFFVSYQGTRQVNGISGSQTLSLPVGLYNSDRTAASLGAAYAGQTGANGGLAIAADGSNISPTALALLNYKFSDGQYMIPSPTSAAKTNNYSWSVPGIFNEDQFIANVDHQFGAVNHLSVKGLLANQPELRSVATATVPGFGQPQDLKTRALSVEDIHIFSPHVVNEAHIGYMRLSGIVNYQSQVPVSAVNMTRYNASTGPTSIFGLLPEIVVSGSLGGFTLGYNTGGNQGQHDNTFDYWDFVSITKGRHSIRVGGEVRRYQDNYYDWENVLGNTTVYSFTDFLLGRPGGSVASGGNGTSLGALSSTTVSTTNATRGARLTDYTLYALDDWKVSNKLTINVGLRWDKFGVGVDTKGRDGNFWPALYTPPPSGGYTSAGFVQQNTAVKPVAGLTSVNPGLIYNSLWKNFSPRFGFAYQLHPKIAIRGGYGIFFDQLTNQAELRESLAPPNYEKSSLSTSDASSFSLQNPFPTLPTLDQLPIAPKLYDPFTYPSSALLSTYAVDPNESVPYYQQYLLNGQWEATRNLLIEVGYIGSKGTKLADQIFRNQPALASTGGPVNGLTTNTAANRSQRVPFLGMSPSGLIWTESGADSRYNALEISATQRLSHGMQFLISFTRSHSVDDNSGDSGGIYEQTSGDQLNIHQATGPSAFDRPSRLIASFVYDIPKWKLNALTSQVFGNWELNGVVTLQSGLPFTITDANGAAYYGTGTSRASLAAGRTMASSKKGGSVTSKYKNYFDTTAFVTAGNLYGNTSRNALRGPGSANWDVSLLKNISLGGERSFQFRSEFFNIFNHTNFGNPGSELSSGSTFGVISTQVGNPRIIQFAGKLRF